MVYTTKVMTENVAYPVFLMTTLAFVRALERPSNGRQLVALGMIAVAVMARAEMLVLVPACLSVLLLIAVLDVRAEERGIRLCSVSSRLGSYKLTWLVTAGGLLALLALGSTMLPGSLLGAHDRVVHALVFSSAPRRFLYQVAELDLAIGVIPFAAFLLTAMLVFRDPRLSRNARVHVAVAVSFFFWFMLLGALYATQARVHSHVFERYVFYVMPLLFLSLALWMARGLPRPKPWGALVPVVAALLPATLPFTSLLDGREWGVSSSTPGLVPWALLRFAIGAHGLMIVAVLSITTMLAGLVLVVRPEGRQRLLVVLTLTLLAVSLTIGVANAALSRLGGTFRNDVDPAWIDAAVGSEAEVGAIWSGDQTKSNNAYRLLEDQFFNSSVRTVYDLRRPMKPGVPSQPLTVRGARLFLRNGASAGRPLVLDYVLTEPSIGIVGRPVATSPGSRLVLYRVGGDVQLTPAGVRRLAGSPEPSELDR
jgi:hypothetical protein